MLHVLHSNAQEALVAHFLETLTEGVRNPLHTEKVLVQVPGFARWLKMRMADHFGIATQVDFMPIASFIWQTYRHILPDLPAESVYDRSQLRWRILPLLLKTDLPKAFATVSQYIAADPLRADAMAQRLAGLYEQYLLYRPDWIISWEQGEVDHWQAQLWRMLVVDQKQPHRVHLHQQTLEALQQHTTIAGLPKRLFVFGRLPPMQLALLDQLAQAGLPIQLYVLNPCAEFWDDVVQKKYVSTTAYLESGHTLLAATGQETQDFLRVLHQFNTETESCFIDLPRQHLLHALQQDMLELTPSELRLCHGNLEQDQSIQLHSAHSPLREIEILHDQLRHLLEQHTELTPADIVVMTPDFTEYAPLIDAVFSAVPQDHYLPWRMSDTQEHTHKPWRKALLELLDIPLSRMEVDRVIALSLLAQTQLSITQKTLNHWVNQAGIRWGWDAQDKSQTDLPAEPNYTWRLGLDRLLLGLALDDQQLFAEHLACTAAQTDRVNFGKWVAWLEPLQLWYACKHQQHTVAEWIALFQRTIEQLFTPQDDPDQAEKITVNQLFRTVIEQSHHFTEKVNYDFIQQLLTSTLTQSDDHAQGFLSGGITLCAMVPMRAIPFKVVCLIGLNDGVFPSVATPVSFDLMAQDPRIGDRSRRNDDRQLFLDALLSARQTLYISWCGHSIQDNHPQPPSTLVSELLDTLDHDYPHSSGKLWCDQVIVHPLTAHSARYYSGLEPHLVSYRAASTSVASATKSMFFDTPLTHDTPSSVPLTDLINFWKNPARFMLQRHLTLYLRQYSDVVSTEEPFILDKTSKKTLLSTFFLQAKYAHLQSDRERIAYAQAAQWLPPHPIGAIAAQSALEQGHQLPALAHSHLLLIDQSLTIELDRIANEVTLLGHIMVSEEGYSLTKLDQAYANDRLSLWVHHVVLNALQPTASQLVYIDKQTQYTKLAPLDTMQARRYLADLLLGFLSSSRAPLPFFPATSEAYMRDLHKNADFAAAQLKAYQVWSPDNGGGQSNSHFNSTRYCEGTDPDIELLWRGQKPLNHPDFALWAERIWLPFINQDQL